MRKTKEIGVTLIALVITIIVLLILAGVAINIIIGDNGIFKKADESAKVYQNAANNEATELNNLYDELTNLINKVNGGTTEGGGSGETPGNPDDNGIFTGNSTINGGEASAFNPEIPKGFKPVDEDTAIWGDGSSAPTEEAVKAGLIIEDGEGNQFVWIAVDETTVALGRYKFAEDGTASAYLGSFIEEDATDTANLKNYGNTIAKDINVFKTSVANHGGYYIARYEASYGTDGKANSKVSTGTPSTSKSNPPTTEGQLWNNITQPNAAIACRNMYDSSYGITSDLMNSYAWDTAIVFIQAYSGDKDYSQQGSINNTSLSNTGTNGDEVCHINDMASNCMEWTTETSSDAGVPCVSRGGIYGISSVSFTSNRYDYWANTAGNNVAFRPTLYL